MARCRACSATPGLGTYLRGVECSLLEASHSLQLSQDEAQPGATVGRGNLMLPLLASTVSKQNCMLKTLRPEVSGERESNWKAKGLVAYHMLGHQPVSTKMTMRLKAIQDCEKECAGLYLSHSLLYAVRLTAIGFLTIPAKDETNRIKKRCHQLPRGIQAFSLMRKWMY